MKVLIACEESQTVCKAFREKNRANIPRDRNEVNMNKALLSSEKMDWRTPKDFFRELDQEFHFGLDAAASPENAKCERYFTPEMDGLSCSWSGYGAVFCNPPYGREIGKWVQKAYSEYVRGGG